jgi:hypothetical protein
MIFSTIWYIKFLKGMAMITEGFSALWHKIKRRQVSDPSAGHGRKLKFRCNICGATCKSFLVSISREISDCQQCGSTLRMRALIALLSEALFNKSLAIPDFPVRPEICGIGMSDWEGYAIPLARKLSYTNTFYHQEPLLDIMNIMADREKTCDFIISRMFLSMYCRPSSRLLIMRTGC